MLRRSASYASPTRTRCWWMTVHHIGALECGADLVVQSAHKTLGSLTQSAFLHLGEGEHCMLCCLGVVLYIRQTYKTQHMFSRLVVVGVNGRSHFLTKGRLFVTCRLTHTNIYLRRANCRELGRWRRPVSGKDGIERPCDRSELQPQL